MAATPNLPEMIAPQPEGIPETLRAARRWAPWRAEWNPRANKGRGKWTKIPHRADRPEYGLSNKSTAGWVTFEQAMAVYRANPERFAGVGYLMTGPHGVTGVDLDHCVHDGVVDDWAAEIVAQLDSYTEISPSGTGLHVLVAGSVPEDWTNHEQGVEVYGGNAARFLCITGRRLDGAPATVRSPRRADALEGIATRYRKAETAKADVEDLHLPPLVPLEYLPTLDELDLPPSARNFLADGPEPGQDRSRALFAAAIALSQAGLDRTDVLSILEANEHAMQIALDHRRQDYDKALRYLWKDHCRAGATRAAQLRQLQLDEFPDYEDSGDADEAPPQVQQGPESGAGGVFDDFEDLDADPGAARPVEAVSGPAPADPRHADLAPVKAARFTPMRPDAFLRRGGVSWIVKGLVPRAGLAVIYGPSGSGKTFLTFDLCGAVARGADWRGMQTRAGRVVYIVAEGAQGFKARMQAYCQQHAIDPADLDVWVIPDAPNLILKDDIRDLIRALLELGKVAMVVIDTYARTMAGANENDAKDVGQAVAHCDAIHRKTGALVVLVHHSGKDTANGARGHSALRAAVDLEMEVTRTRSYRAVTVTKLKDGGDEGKEYRFRLAEIQIGEDEDGDPITSCVLDHLADAPAVEQKEDGATKPPSPVRARILEQLATYLSGEVEREQFIQDVRAITPLPPTGVESPSWKALITRPLDKLIRGGEVIEANGVLSLPKITE